MIGSTVGRWLGAAFGVKRLRAAQHRRRRRGAVVAGWIVTVFGAGDQDAFDGAVVRITDRQCPGTRRVQAGIAKAAEILTLDPGPFDTLEEM